MSFDVDLVFGFLEDPCADVRCGYNAYCVSGYCYCNSGYEGDANVGCQPVSGMLLPSLFVVLTVCAYLLLPYDWEIGLALYLEVKEMSHL